MSNERQLNQARLVAENRQLRTAIEQILEEMEQSGQAKGAGQNPDSGIDAARIRDTLPDKPGRGKRSDEGISPPWEREGYDSKESWLADKKGE